MKKPINEEFKRMQQLAGLNEIKVRDPGIMNRKALEVLFYPDPYEEGVYRWDENAMRNFIRDIGYYDYEDVAKEVTHYTSPGDEDEMSFFRQQTNNPNLQPTDLTLGMYKKSIEDEFEKEI